MKNNTFLPVSLNTLTVSTEYFEHSKNSLNSKNPKSKFLKSKKTTYSFSSKRIPNPPKDSQRKHKSPAQH